MLAQCKKVISIILKMSWNLKNVHAFQKKCVWHILKSYTMQNHVYVIKKCFVLLEMYIAFTKNVMSFRNMFMALLRYVYRW